ncbi:MAG TPA: hypothetical protein VFL31_02815 [Nitrospiraceae bacterium]|nr:hypothetical protein [Nitrospiraceae bacterium]
MSATAARVFKADSRCGIVGRMLLAGFFGAILLAALVLGDWIHFTSLTAPSSRYGCGIARVEDRLPLASLAVVIDRFDRNGLLALPHGVARFFREEKRIVLRPQYQLFSLKFRTAWPLKGSIELEPEVGATKLTCVKRIPWSSALLTLVWFAVVGVGTVGFVVSFLAKGGLTSFSGVVMVLGITGLGLMVLTFGLTTVSLAYRLENQRLTEVYQELRAALASVSPRPY